MAKKKQAAPKKAAKKTAPKKAPKSNTPENPDDQHGKVVGKNPDEMYAMYRGAKVNNSFPPSRSRGSNLHVDVIINEESGETETHLLDLRQVPQDIIDSFVEE